MGIFDEFKRLSKTSMELASGVTRLARLELQLAEKSLPQIAVLAFLLIVLLTSAWLCILALLMIYVTSLGVSWVLCLITALILHLILAIIVALVLKKRASHLSFSATRQHLKFHTGK